MPRAPSSRSLRRLPTVDYEICEKLTKPLRNPDLSPDERKGAWAEMTPFNLRETKEGSPWGTHYGPSMIIGDKTIPELSEIDEEIPTRVAADKAYQNAIKNSDRQNARIEHDNALQRVLIDLLSDHTELFKQFQDDPSFKKWLSYSIFSATYKSPPPGSESVRRLG